MKLSREVQYLSTETQIDANIDVKNFDGWKLSHIVLNGRLLMTQTLPQTLNDGDVLVLNYEPQYYKLKVRYVMKDTYNDIQDADEVTLRSGEIYNYPPKEIIGYKLVETLGNGLSQDAIYQDTNITYVYDTLKTSVTIKYCDADGNEIKPSEQITDEYGNPYNIAPPDIDGYEYVTHNGSLSGKFGLENQEVSFFYAKSHTGVTIQYVDEDGNLLDSELYSATIGDHYNIQPKNIKGYTCLSANTQGTVTDNLVVVFTYQKNKHNITVKYVDEGGMFITSEEVFECYYNEVYSTSAKNIIGYSLLYESGNTNGTIGDEDIEIIYTYQKMDTQITIQYVDELGNVLRDETHKTVKYGDEYNISCPNIDGYVIKEMPDDSNGIMNQLKKTITFVYEKKDVQIEIRYVDESGKQIKEVDHITKKYQDFYETEHKSIDGYMIKEIPSNASGTVGTENIIVTYVYMIDSSQVKLLTATVQFDLDGEIQENDQININKYVHIFESDSIDVSDIQPIDYYGYKLSYVTLNGETISVLPQNVNNNDTVIFHYEREDFQVDVKYIDENGNSIFEMDTIHLKYKDSYQITEKQIDGYELISTSGNTKGIAEDNITVYYIYKCLDYGISIQYVTDDKTLDIETITGKYGEVYSTTEKEFRGYEFVSKTGNYQGMFTKNDTVIYTYKPIETQITVRYVDSNGEQLIPEEQIFGSYRDVYETSAKEIKGYMIKEFPQNASGLFDINNFEIVYIYEVKQFIITINYQDKDGTDISEKDIVYLDYGDEYEITLKNIDGYKLISKPENLNGMIEENLNITCIYEKLQGNVIIHYVNIDTNEEFSNDTLDGYFYDSYETHPIEIEGFTLVEIPDNAYGFITEETVDVYYYYKPIIMEKEQSTVIIRYIDIEGNILLPEEQLIGDLGTLYETEYKEIDGYEISEIPFNASGTMDIKQITVTYVYKLIKQEKATIKVNYIDSNGKEISNHSVIEGLVGEPYRIGSKQIDGYKLISTNGNAYGFMTKEEIVIDFVYEKDIIQSEIIEQGNTLTISDCKDNLLSIQIYNYNSFPIEYNGKKYNTGALIAIIPVKNNEASILGLPYGIYRIKEYKTTTGYSKDKNYYIINFNDGTQKEEGKVRIIGKNNSSLKGIKFSIVNLGSDIIYNGNVIGRNQKVDSFVINDNNITLELPYGPYEIRNIEFSKDLVENTYKVKIDSKATDVTILLKEDVIVSECNHKWDNGTVVNPTCSSNGFVNYKCELCGDISTEVIKKLEHDFIEKESTCSENGYKQCKNCDYYVSLPKSEHNWNDGKVINVDFCTNTAIQYTCYDCFGTKIEYGNTLEKHTFETVIEKGSSSSEGQIVKVCTKCGYREVESILNKIQTIELDKEKFVYSDSPQKPQITVCDENGNIISSKYYTIQYKDNVRVGKASVVVKFNGVYEGKMEKEFEIVPLGTRILSFTSLNKGFTVKWAIQHKDVDGYEIQYSLNENFSNANTLNATSYTTLVKTISGLNSNTKYYVRIRTYKGKYYSDWSETKEVTTK